LAAEGVRFEHAIVQKTKTSPSMASLLTSTYAHTHGIITGRSWLPSELDTLAELLAGAGLRTAAFVSNSNLDSTFNFHQGFETHVNARPTVGSNVAEAVNGLALPWLEENHEEPFFLYVHYIDPHAPYDPPPPFRDRFVGDEHFGELGDPGVPIGRGFVGVIPRSAAIEDGSTDLDLYRARYDGEIAYMDAKMGELLGRLRELGLEEETLVVFTSDHGESLWEHGVYCNHGLFAYENNTRVPLVFRYPPALPAGRVAEAVVQSIDVMPTILELLRLQTPPQAEGESLLPLLLGEGTKRLDAAFSEAGYVKGLLITAIRTRRWKLIHNPRGVDVARDAFRPRILLSPTRARRLWGAAHGGPGGNRRWELFDVQADPGETVNLARERPEVLRTLRHRLEAWQAQAPPGRDPKRLPKTKLPDEVREELRALGYLR
jgi:arylsulfatase A-like enzyme